MVNAIGGFVATIAAVQPIPLSGTSTQNLALHQVHQSQALLPVVNAMPAQCSPQITSSRCEGLLHLA